MEATPVASLTLTNFRSYVHREFALDPGTSLVVGPNASGKTNLLESLFVMATTRSFKARDESLVRHGEDYYRIEARVGTDQLALSYHQTDAGKRKVAQHNNAKKPLRQHVGRLPVVLFEPGDLNLLTGPPRARRGYLDNLLCQTDPDYLLALAEYKRALKQRNALLSQPMRASQDVLFVWNVRLAQPAALLQNKRAELAAFLANRLPELYSQIAGRKHLVEIQYLPSPDHQNFGDEAIFLEQLETRVPADLATGFTTIGPHRDDFSVLFDTKPIANIASRGEHRSVVLALKIAELEYQTDLAKHRPLLMLDDVFSELDRARRAFLLEQIEGYQTIVTTTDAELVGGKKYYTIELGGRGE